MGRGQETVEGDEDSIKSIEQITYWIFAQAIS